MTDVVDSIAGNMHARQPGWMGGLYRILGQYDGV